MDAETREWLEGFEKRIDAKFKQTEDRLTAKHDFTDGWLKAEIEEMRRDVKGIEAKMDHGLATIGRELRSIDSRVRKLEVAPPVAAE